MGKRSINSIKSIYTGIGLKLTVILLNFASRFFFIKFLGEQCLGLNGLFTTILSLFSLAELGIGDAIAFYLYKPIAEQNKEKLRQLVAFCKKCYRVIGFAILGIGVLLIPVLDKLVNFDYEMTYNLYVIYLLYLANTVVTYVFFTYPQTVLNANQEKYTINVISTVFTFVIFVCDIVSLALTRNYIVYLACRLVLTVFQNWLIFYKARKKYSYTFQQPSMKLSKGEVRRLFADVYKIFVVKVSSKLIDSTDNLFISYYLGTLIVGFNSNYLFFTNAAMSIINTTIYSFGPSVGDLNVSENRDSVVSTFYLIDYLNFCIAFFASVCLFGFLNPFIKLIWGDKYLFSSITVALLCLNFYIVTCIYTIFVFRHSLGLFKYYAYNTLFTAICNIVLDFLLVNRLGVAGLYLATLVSNLVFGIWPYVKNVFQIGFGISARKHICLMIIRMLYTILFGAIIYIISNLFDSSLLGFMGVILSTCVVLIIGILLTGLFDKQFMVAFNYLRTLFKGVKK